MLDRAPRAKNALQASANETGKGKSLPSVPALQMAIPKTGVTEIVQRIPEDYADGLRALGWTSSGGGWYWPGTAYPHIHMTVFGPDFHNRIDLITMSFRRGNGSVGHLHYMQGGTIGATPINDCDNIIPGASDKITAAISYLEG